MRVRRGRRILSPLVRDRRRSLYDIRTNRAVQPSEEPMKALRARRTAGLGKASVLRMLAQTPASRPERAPASGLAKMPAYQRSSGAPARSVACRPLPRFVRTDAQE